MFDIDAQSMATKHGGVYGSAMESEELTVYYSSKRQGNKVLFTNISS